MLPNRTATVSRRWRTVSLIAVGVALGSILTATPVYSHVGGTAQHLWKKHVEPKADKRYANAAPGTDKARNANKLDGLDSTDFVQGQATVYANRFVTTSSFGGDILHVPGFATVSVLNCRTSLVDSNAQVDVDDSQPIDGWRNTGSGLFHARFPAGGAFTTPLSETGHTVIQLAKDTGETARVEVWNDTDSSRCLFVVTATVYG